MRLSPRAAAQLMLVAVASLAAACPPSPPTVERWYADWLYPIIQAGFTSASNRVPVPLFDAALVVLAGAFLIIWFASVRRTRRERSLKPLGRGLVTTLVLAAGIYLWFLAAWGLNYARPPLETVLPYDASKVTPAAVRALAEHSIAEANRTHAAGHAAGFAPVSQSPEVLMTALHEVERELGRPRPTVFAHPKRSILSPFYRASGVSGMLAPFFLETLLNPDLTGPERPAVLAHEWAHLSGYAPESDASFIGLLAALRSGPAGEYSAWLDLVSESVNQLQPVTQRVVLAKLAQGPRDDQQAIRERLKARVQPVQDVAWTTYDHMLKSQGVREGVKSYSRVVQLLIGTDVLKVPTSAEATAGKPGPQ